VGVSTRASTRTRASWSCNSLSMNKRDNLSVSIVFTKKRDSRDFCLGRNERSDPIRTAHRTIVHAIGYGARDGFKIRMRIHISHILDLAPSVRFRVVLSRRVACGRDVRRARERRDARHGRRGERGRATVRVSCPVAGRSREKLERQRERGAPLLSLSTTSTTYSTVIAIEVLALTTRDEQVPEVW